MHKLRHYRHRIAHDDEPPQAEEDLELIANVDSKTRSIIELMAGVELNDTDISLRTALRNWADKRCDAMASWSGEWSEAKAQSEVFQSYEKSTSELARAMSKKIEELGRLYERWNDLMEDFGSTSKAIEKLERKDKGLPQRIWKHFRDRVSH